MIQLSGATVSIADGAPDDIEWRLAVSLKALRLEKAMTLDRLAEQSGVSRATIARIEAGETSPTLNALKKLASALDIPLSRLMAAAEQSFDALIEKDKQAVWQNPETGFLSRTVSPAQPPLSGEVLACELPVTQRASHDRPSRPGREHHLYLLEGGLTVTEGGRRHVLKAGDCLRCRLFGPCEFLSSGSVTARYLLFLV